MFALLVPRSDVPPASISVSDDERTHNLDNKTPVKVETDHAADNDTDDDDVNSTTSDDSDTEVDDDGDDNHQDQDDDQDPDTVNDGQIESAIGISRLPDDDWLATEHVVQLLQQPPPEIRHQTVPKGRKDNSYCVVDNIVNTERHQRGQRRQYDDDCGAWNTSGGRLCSFPYIVSSARLQRVFLHDGQYCRERKVDGVRTYVAIDPQPPASDVVTVTRYYGTSGLDPNFKKRVSWLVDDDGPSDVAVVEYKGIQPGATVHGNATSTKRPYIRTPAATMDKVAAAVVTAPPKSVYADCLMEMSPTTAPRSSRAVRDKRHNELQKQRQRMQTVHRLNFADEILQVSYFLG